MADIPRQATHLRVALQLGLLAVADVISWADSLIAASDRPQPVLIELSCMWKANPFDVVHVLASMSEGVQTLDVLPSVLGLAHERLLMEPAYGRRLARALVLIWVDCASDVPEELSDIGWFDDAFDLAADSTIGSVEDVQAQLLDFTRRFVGRRTDRFTE